MTRPVRPTPLSGRSSSPPGSSSTPGDRSTPLVAPEPLAPLAAGLRDGSIDLVEWLGRLEERIAAVDPAVHALLPEPGRFERLRRAAGDLVARWPDPAARPPLWGVAVGVKDVFHVRGFPTAAGSRLPPEALAGIPDGADEAVAVEALRAAGALVLGKTVSTEFAFFGPGPTENPHRPGHTPGGSSSGSAAAVAAGLCPLALGTQTVGSLTRPAGFCGVVAFKPSWQRIGRVGVFPLAPSLDHVGLFTADAAGAALAAATLCRDWRPAAAAAAAAAAAGTVLGVPEGPLLDRAGEAARAGFAAACAALETAGFVVHRVPELADLDEVEARHWRILAAEAAAVHQDLYPRFGALYHPKTRELVERGLAAGGAAAAGLERDRAGRAALARRLEAAMDAHGLDLWITPAATGPAPAGLDSTGDPAMNLPWTHAGLPTLALPAGSTPDGLPLGVQLAARWGRDEELLGRGPALEAAVAGAAR